MPEEYWDEIAMISGDLQAEILRGLLEAQGIRVWLSQEGGGHSVYSLTVGELGTVHILVPASQSQAAQAVLQDYYSGKFEGTQFTDESGRPIPPTTFTSDDDEPEDEEPG